MTNSFCLRFAGTLLPRRAAWPGDNDSSRTAGDRRQRLWAKSVRGFHIESEEKERGGYALIGKGGFYRISKIADYKSRTASRHVRATGASYWPALRRSFAAAAPIISQGSLFK